MRDPRRQAGVKEIVIATPRSGGYINPEVVYAAKITGVRDILTVGGAQAIAALAYGTKSVNRVDKIVGPGNIYVTAAKRMVYGTVDIDMMAGPSEVIIIADENDDASHIAADLMSQAEHDPQAASVLITESRALAEAVDAQLAVQLERRGRRKITEASLENFGSAVIVNSLEEAARLSDKIAPEHLELAVRIRAHFSRKFTNAGSVFSRYTPEPLAIYMAGLIHVFHKRNGRFSSALSVDSFIKNQVSVFKQRGFSKK